MAKSGDDSRKLGAEGEGLAADFLRSKGFKVIGRNLRYGPGEIDIVAVKGKDLHFIEVKTRFSDDFVSPLDAITDQKQRKIFRAAECFLMDSGNSFNIDEPPPCYFDVIAIKKNSSNVEIELIEDAFKS